MMLKSCARDFGSYVTIDLTGKCWSNGINIVTKWDLRKTKGFEALDGERVWLKVVTKIAIQSSVIP